MPRARSGHTARFRRHVEYLEYIERLLARDSPTVRAWQSFGKSCNGHDDGATSHNFWVKLHPGVAHAEVAHRSCKISRYTQARDEPIDRLRHSQPELWTDMRDTWPRHLPFRKIAIHAKHRPVGPSSQSAAAISSQRAKSELCGALLILLSLWPFTRAQEKLLLCTVGQD